MPEEKPNAQNPSDHVIGFQEFVEEVAEYLDEVAGGKILTADETDGSIEYFPTAKSDEEIFGKKRDEHSL